MTDRPSIESVLEHYDVVGRTKKVSCPLHEDRVPSCSINYDEDLWRCHSCGEGGSSWDLIIKKEGLKDFRAAVEWARTTLGLTDGGARDGGGFVSGSRYAARRTVPTGKGDRAGGGKYVPSWRR